MTGFRVRFCNDLLDSNGHHFRACQREIEIEQAEDEKSAVEEAKREFERLEHVRDWRLRARSVHCEPVLERE